MTFLNNQSMDMIKIFTMLNSFESHQDRFEEEKNLGKLFPWKYIQSQIDPSIGRNTLLALLKFKGILDRYNQPNSKSPYYQYFKLSPIRPIPRSKYYYYGPLSLYISGHGIVEIRKEIDSIRQMGGSI